MGPLIPIIGVALLLVVLASKKKPAAPDAGITAAASLPLPGAQSTPVTAQTAINVPMPPLPSGETPQVIVQPPGGQPQTLQQILTALPAQLQTLPALPSVQPVPSGPIGNIVDGSNWKIDHWSASSGYTFLLDPSGVSWAVPSYDRTQASGSEYYKLSDGRMVKNPPKSPTYYTQSGIPDMKPPEAPRAPPAASPATEPVIPPPVMPPAMQQVLTQVAQALPQVAQQVPSGSVIDQILVEASKALPQAAPAPAAPSAPQAAPVPSAGVVPAAVSLAAKMIDAESKAGWKTNLKGKAEITDWQKKVGLKADGMFGPVSASRMAQEVTLLPLLRYFPAGSQKTTVLSAYRAGLESLAKSVEADPAQRAHAKGLRSSAAYEMGQGYVANPAAVPVSQRAMQLRALAMTD